MAKKDGSKGKGLVSGKGKKQEPAWFGPTVLAIAIIVVVTLLAVRMCSGPSKEDEEAAEAAKPAPTLVAYPEPDESYPAKRLRYASPDEAEALFIEGCKWFLRWQREELPGRVEVLVFRKRDAANMAWRREPGEEITGDAGEFEKLDEASGRIALRRGKVLARVIGSSGAEFPALEEVARELDAALVRTWGAHPE